jgi:hypothetical protein
MVMEKPIMSLVSLLKNKIMNGPANENIRLAAAVPCALLLDNIVLSSGS